MMTHQEFERLQAKRVEKAFGVSFVVQLDALGTKDGCWWEAKDEDGRTIMSMPIPSTITGLMEQVNSLVRSASKINAPHDPH